MTQSLQNDEAISKLQHLVNEVRICMFATHDDEYNITSRPMATIEVDDSGSIWFFTNEYSEKVNDISKDNKVYLFYSHPDKNTYLHVKSNCTVVNDREKIKEKWNPLFKAWFPDGPDDPKLCFLKTDTQEASYWNGNSNKLISFFTILKAAATGEKYDSGETGSLKIEA